MSSTFLFALAGAAGGWCGTGWFQFVIWYIIHYHRVPGPPGPEPGWVQPLVARAVGVVVGGVASVAAANVAEIPATGISALAAAGAAGFAAAFIVYDVIVQVGLRSASAKQVGGVAAGD